MRIAILHDGPLSEIVAASSLNIGIKNRYDMSEITWVIPEEYKYIYKYNKEVDNTLSWTDVERGDYRKFDLVINLWPTVDAHKVESSFYTGFGEHDDFDKYVGIFDNDVEKIGMNIFQFYYYLSGITWKGEGYSLNYYPRNKMSKKRIGIDIVNLNLRECVYKNLNKNWGVVCRIPHKKNIFRITLVYG